MTDYLLLMLSICINVTGNSINNRFAKQKCSDPQTAAAYNLLLSLAGLAVILVSGKGWSVSAATVGMGLIFGLLNGMSIISRTAALSCGPMTLTLLIGSCGMLIPTFSGALFWKEALGLGQLFGVVLMIIALACIMVKQEFTPMDWKWRGLCLLSFLSVGLISVMQKIHQNSAYAAERTGFLATAFLVSVCINVFILAKTRRQNRNASLRPDLSLLASGLLTGGCTGSIHMLNLYLSGVIPAVLFFPLVNGGAILLAGAVGIFLFREPCTKRQLIGFAMGLIAILCIGGILG